MRPLRIVLVTAAWAACLGAAAPVEPDLLIADFEGRKPLSLRAAGGTARLVSLRAHELESAWGR